MTILKDASKSPDKIQYQPKLQKAELETFGKLLTTFNMPVPPKQYNAQ